MVRNIIQYPTPLSIEYATDVRVFDSKLFSLIEDLKDTMNENHLDGLASYQIGNYFNVVVIKYNDAFIEIINPRLIGHSGSIESEESTAYYPNKSAKIKRFESVSIVYQDRNGEDKTLKASGDLAILLQRKIDYTFGATFIHKMSKVEKERFEKEINQNTRASSKNHTYSNYCPRTFKRDKILLVSNLFIVLIALLFVSSFFLQNSASLWNLQVYSALGVVSLDIVYFFYAQYEGKKYISCDSCQLGNIIGTVTISLFRLCIIMLLSYYFTHSYS